MNALFGKKKKEAPKVDVGQTVETLNNTVENIAMRIKKMEKEVEQNKLEAVTKGKKGDKSGAIIALKKSKMKAGEIAKLEGQQLIIEQQKIALEGAKFDGGVMNALSTGTSALKQVQAEVNIDKLDDLKDDLQEMMDQQ